MATLNLSMLEAIQVLATRNLSPRSISLASVRVIPRLDRAFSIIRNWSAQGSEGALTLMSALRGQALGKTSLINFLQAVSMPIGHLPSMECRGGDRLNML